MNLVCEQNDRFARMLGLCRRAGKVAVGMPLALQALHRRKAFLLIVSSGASPSSLKKIQTQSAHYRIPLITMNIPPESLAHILGKEAPVVAAAVTDQGFAAELFKSSGKEVSEGSEHGI